MACSAAQMEANCQNAKRSTGPKSTENSRKNSLKHGLTGDGIVLPNEDAEALEAKLAAFEADLKPTTITQLELVKRVAVMSIRLDRSYKQEASALSLNMRNAASVYDDAKMAEVDHLISWIGHEPVTNNRRLKRSLRGISRLIAAIEGLRSDLMRQPNYLWSYQHCDQLHHYLGKRREEMPITRIRALTEAIHGKFENLDPLEIPETEIMAKRRWAIRVLVELMDDEIAKLKTLLETFDPSAIELDRAEAADRAMFDASKEGILARKYEAACERAMFKALKELRELQDQEAELEPESEVAPEPSSELGSFFPTSSEAGEAKVNLDAAASKPRPNLEKLARKERRNGRTS